MTDAVKRSPFEPDHTRAADRARVTPPLAEPRFVVREITGYAGRSTALTTSLWIADRWYCYREVETFYGAPGVRASTLRRRAAERCAELNAEQPADATAEDAPAV